MTKLTALTTFLLNLNLFAAEQMESFVDDLTILPACRDTAVAGRIVVCEMDYTAAIFIERYPHKLNPVPRLFGQIAAWLIQHDAERLDANEFPVSVDVLDDETADIEIRIPFTEIVEAVANPVGEIDLGGIRYAIASP